MNPRGLYSQTVTDWFAFCIREDSHRRSILYALDKNVHKLQNKESLSSTADPLKMDRILIAAQNYFEHTCIDIEYGYKSNSYGLAYLPLGHKISILV